VGGGNLTAIEKRSGGRPKNGPFQNARGTVSTKKKKAKFFTGWETAGQAPIKEIGQDRVLSGEYPVLGEQSFGHRKRSTKPKTPFKKRGTRS